MKKAIVLGAVVLSLAIMALGAGSVSAAFHPDSQIDDTRVGHPDPTPWGPSIEGYEYTSRFSYYHNLVIPYHITPCPPPPIR
ncbi:hypothetical protein ACFL2B_02560 [Patescibacteria group bacterium]